MAYLGTACVHQRSAQPSSQAMALLVIGNGHEMVKVSSYQKKEYHLKRLTTMDLK